MESPCSRFRSRRSALFASLFVITASVCNAQTFEKQTAVADITADSQTNNANWGLSSDTPLLESSSSTIVGVDVSMGEGVPVGSGQFNSSTQEFDIDGPLLSGTFLAGDATCTDTRLGCFDNGCDAIFPKEKVCKRKISYKEGSLPAVDCEYTLTLSDSECRTKSKECRCVVDRKLEWTKGTVPACPERPNKEDTYDEKWYGAGCK